MPGTFYNPLAVKACKFDIRRENLRLNQTSLKQTMEQNSEVGLFLI